MEYPFHRSFIFLFTALFHRASHLLPDGRSKNQPKFSNFIIYVFAWHSFCPIPSSHDDSIVGQTYIRAAKIIDTIRLGAKYNG